MCSLPWRGIIQSYLPKLGGDLRRVLPKSLLNKGTSSMTTSLDANVSHLHACPYCLSACLQARLSPSLSHSSSSFLCITSLLLTLFLIFIYFSLSHTHTLSPHFLSLPFHFLSLHTFSFFLSIYQKSLNSHPTIVCSEPERH